MTRLLDINVLLAMVWPQHVHHRLVNDWISDETRKGDVSIATSPITQLGFVRISLNIKGYAADFDSAMGLLDTLVSRPKIRHEFWSDNVSLLSLKRSPNLKIQPGQLTDYYLVALAKERGGRLATLDTGIRDSVAELIV